MDKNKGVKIPAELRFNMWLGLSVHEKEFSHFSEGNFSICVEMVIKKKRKVLALKIQI